MEGLLMSNLRDMRIKREISITDLSKITGIPYRTLQDIELGNISINNTKAINVYKIAKALGVKMESLIERETTKVEKDG